MVVWVIDAAEGSRWREVFHEEQPAWLAVRMQLAPTADGVAVTGVQVERRDGHALTARDLRLVKFPPNWVLHGEAASRWYASEGQAAPVTATRQGARGKDDEHWREVWETWLRAKQVAPRASVKYLLSDARWSVTDATMRRWIARARQRAAELGWDSEPLPQKMGGFLRQDGEPPAETGPATDPDSA